MILRAIRIMGTIGALLAILTFLASTAMAWSVSDPLFVPFLVRGALSQNQPPQPPQLLWPLENGVNQALDVNLWWLANDPDGDALFYDVYFSEGQGQPLELVVTGQANTTYNPGMLKASTSYSWQVVAKDSHGASATGPIWHFSTGDGSLNVSEMVFVPPGAFQMGCDPANNNGSACTRDELPLHEVYLDAFAIDKYEVTNGRYHACVQAGQCSPIPDQSSSTRQSYAYNPEYVDFPAIWINWSQAVEFCAWDGKRLPTEAEWEKAARGSQDTRPFPWGNEAPDCSRANFLYGGSRGMCVGDTVKVGSYPNGASPYGAMDMAGNIWEWVNDSFQLDYYSISPYANPPGPATGKSKVLRGGNWQYDWTWMRTTDRLSYDNPWHHHFFVGFRCALSLGR